jgi:hypothetical protein
MTRTPSSSHGSRRSVTTDLAHGHVLDFYLLAEGVDFEMAGNVFDCRPNDDFAEVHELLLRDESLLTELHHAEGLGVTADEMLVVDGLRPKT